MEELEKQTPVRQSLCGSLRRDGHWKCLCLTLLISGCLTAISWCHFTLAANKSPAIYRHSLALSDSGRHGPCKEGYIYIPVAFVVMLYLVYLVECWHSHARLELRYKCDINTVYSRISDLQDALPVIWWKATCYHYVRRTRQVMRYRNGDAFTSTQVYYERVDSSTAGAAFNFTRCGVKDISRPLVELEKHAAIKIKVSKGFSFANLDTEMEFEEQRAQFFQEYETRDDYMEGREGMDMVNTEFKEYMIAFKDPNNLPWYVSHAMYWAASVLLLSWPLRVVIEYKTAHLHYHIHKLFGSNYLEGEGQGGALSRVSTMNSAELEMSIRNNNVIVPSYSEAVLCGEAEAEDDESTLLQRQPNGYGAIKKVPTGGKLSRSLTTATLAGRSSLSGHSAGDGTSSRRASITPAITMNRVKRFKSCGTFVKADSIEESPSIAGTARQQIQQLFRDRGRLQRHKGRSTYSVSGLSLDNGRAARFSVGTPGTPDDRVVSPTISIYSAVYYRPGSGYGDADVASSNENSVRSELYRDIQRSRNHVRPHSVALDATDHRISSNQESLAGTDRLDTASSAAMNDNMFSQDANPSRPLVLRQGSRRHRNVSLPFSRENSMNFETVVAHVEPTPTSPTSPPQYENAIMMKTITSTSAGQNTVKPSERPAAIKLKRKPSHEPLRNQKRLLNSPVSLDEDSPHPTSVPPPTAAAYPLSHQTLQSNQPFCHQNKRDNPTQFKHQPQRNVQDSHLPCDEPSTSYQAKYYSQEQPNATVVPNRLLKALPKVSSNILVESDDSHSESLQSSRPGTYDGQNVPLGSSRGLRLSRHGDRELNSQSSSAQPRAPATQLPAHLRDGSNPATAVSSTAASLAFAEAGHQETPV